jgi:hypothetical protein
MKIVPLTDSALDAFLALSAPLAGDSSNLADESIQSERRAEQDANLKEIGDILLRKEGGLMMDAVFVLRKPVCIAGLLGRAAPDQYTILNYICDALRRQDEDHAGFHFVTPLSDEVAWQRSISLARRVMALSDYNHYDINNFSRAHAVADACRRLEKRGIKIGLSSFGPILDTEDVSALCKEIEDTIRTIGGRNAINAILAWHRSNRRIYEGSILYGRKVDQIGNARDPSVPFHLLYNLSLKHLNASQTTKQPRDDFRHAVVQFDGH